MPNCAGLRSYQPGTPSTWEETRSIRQEGGYPSSVAGGNPRSCLSCRVEKASRHRAGAERSRAALYGHQGTATCHGRNDSGGGRRSKGSGGRLSLISQTYRQAALASNMPRPCAPMTRLMLASGARQAMASSIENTPNRPTARGTQLTRCFATLQRRWPISRRRSECIARGNLTARTSIASWMTLLGWLARRSEQMPFGHLRPAAHGSGPVFARPGRHSQWLWDCWNPATSY